MTAPITSTDLRRVAGELRGIDKAHDAVKAARLAVASLDGLASRMDAEGRT